MRRSTIIKVSMEWGHKKITVTMWQASSTFKTLGRVEGWRIAPFMGFLSTYYSRVPTFLAHHGHKVESVWHQIQDRVKVLISPILSNGFHLLSIFTSILLFCHFLLPRSRPKDQTLTKTPKHRRVDDWRMCLTPLISFCVSPPGRALCLLMKY